MTWDRELRVLDQAIRRLNAEYDAFIFGSVARPPLESRRHVEEMFRRLGQSPSDSAADRYQLSSLQGRFSSLCERWERLQAEKEAGRRPGSPVGFSPVHPGSSAGASNAPAPGSVEAGREGGSSRDRQLFERYVAARGKLGEETSGFRLEAFLARLEEERVRLRARLGITEVDFDVVERDGKIKLVAKPKQNRESEVPGRK